MGGMLSSKQPVETQAPSSQPIPNPQPQQPPEASSTPTIRQVTYQGPEFPTQFSPENQICVRIDPIIKDYIKLARDQPVQNIGVPVSILATTNGGPIPILRLSAFVDLANGALQSHTNFRLPYIQSIYKMADVEHSCNGIIVLKYTYINPLTGARYYYETSSQEVKGKFKSYFYFNFGGGDQKIYVPVTKQDNEPNLYLFKKNPAWPGGTYQPVRLTQEENNMYSTFFYEKFTKKFLTQYNNPNCKFISIAINLLPLTGGHANMLLVYKGVSKVYIMLYEPHGAEGVKMSDEKNRQYNQMNSEFMVFIQNVINERSTDKRPIEIVKPYNISTNVGIQRYMKDKNGYCYMITSFWLYIILKLINEGFVRQENEEKFILNLNYIEECVYKRIDTSIKEDKKAEPKGRLAKYSSSQVLNSLIVHFSYDFLTTFYMNYFIPNNPLYKIFTKSFKIFYVQEEGTLKFKNEIFIENMRPEGRYNLTQDEINRIEDQAVEISKLMADDLACIKNEDCLSYNCKERKCKPREDYTQSQGSTQQLSQDEESQQSMRQDYKPGSIQRTESVTRQVEQSYYPIEKVGADDSADEKYNDERFSVISDEIIGVASYDKPSEDDTIQGHEKPPIKMPKAKRLNKS